jgi:hypothetical protein
MRPWPSTPPTRFPVAGHGAVGQHRGCGGLERGEIAARIGLGRPVGVANALLRDLGQPPALLLRRAPDEYRAAAEEGGQDAGGDAGVEPGHLLAHPVDIEGAAAHPAVLLGNEQKLDPQLVAAHAADDVLRADIVVVRPQLEFSGNRAGDVVPDRLRGHLECPGVQAGAGRHRRGR